MSLNRNKFIDPAGFFDDYEWPVNHSEEDGFGKTRKVTNSANTRQTGLVRQQADDEPMVLKLKGTMLHADQVYSTFLWFETGWSRTIIFEDFTGEQYEVLLTSFVPTRVRAADNPQDRANAPLWIWKYDMEMEVISFVSGLHANAHVTP